MQVPEREFRFIEGVRALGSIQILLNHYVFLFFPVLVRIAPAEPHSWMVWAANSPLFFLLDGSIAVFCFFLMSGQVLTFAFLNSSLALPAQVVKRFLRLFLPVLGSLILATALFALLPGLTRELEALNPTFWVSKLHQFAITPDAIPFRDIFLNSMLLGYKGASVFDYTVFSAFGITPQGLPNSLNPPLWSLHFEFWGSVLTIFLCWLYRRLPRKVFWVVFAVCFAAVAVTPLSVFLVGFLAYVFRHLYETIRSGWLTSISSLVLIVSGILISSYSPLVSVVGYLEEKQIIAVMMFVAVLLSPALQRFLSAPVFLWMGRMSFSLYVIHFPLLFTVFAAFFLWLEPVMGYTNAALVTTVAGVPLSILLSVAFERLVDRPSIALARRVGNLISRR
jgi:peptidoglycan/LPS O-acetylase OafA/YrhL